MCAIVKRGKINSKKDTPDLLLSRKKNGAGIMKGAIFGIKKLNNLKR